MIFITVMFWFGMIFIWSCRSQKDVSPSDKIGSCLESLIPVEISRYDHLDPVLVECLGDKALEEKDFIEFEPHAAVNPANPNNIVVAWILRAREASGAICVSSSFDGGQTWSTPHILPFHQCAGGLERARFASDPWTAFGPDGRAYVGAIAFDVSEVGDTFSTLLVFYSRDGGKTWEGPSIAVPNMSPYFVYDNLALKADPLNPEKAYLLSTQYQSVGVPPKDSKISDMNKAGPAAFTKTTDGGITWSPIRPISPVVKGERVSAPEMVIDPIRGTLYAVYYRETKDEATLAFVKSDDQGETWSGQRIVANYMRLNKQGFADTVIKFRKELTLLTAQDIIHGAVDPRTGRVLIAFADGRFTQGKYLQVAVTFSDDGGESWAAPFRVSQSHYGHAWLPSIVVNSSGVVGVSYLDMRNWDMEDKEHFPASLWLSCFRIQEDGTMDHLKETLVDQFNMLGAGAEGYYGTGDYEALLAIGDCFHPVYIKSKCAPQSVGCLQPGSSRTGLYFSK